MPDDWREELQQDPRAVELRSAIWGRWRILARDKEFVRWTMKLRRRLERAFASDPETVRQFFRSYSSPTGSRRLKIKAYLRGIEKEEVRVTLRSYAEYFARFRVRMYFRKKSPHFRTQLLLPWSNKFHAKILNGHLHPCTDRGGPYIDQFETDKLEVPSPLEELIETGGAKFFRIDDKDGSSVLTEIEAFAYHAEGLTFILHRAEIPYLICLIGEKTSSKTWRAAERTLHVLQREYYSRVNAGVPADIKQILKVAAAARKSGSSKDKAITIGKTDNPWSNQSAFSRQKTKIT